MPKKCFLCNSGDFVIDFNDNSFKRCSSKLAFRKEKNFKHSEVELTKESLDFVGYHLTCYKKVTVLGKKYHEEFRIFTRKSTELLIVDDSSESDHGTGSDFATFRESTEEQLVKRTRSHETHTERPLTRESTRRKRKESKADPLSDSSPVSKKERQRNANGTTAQIQEIDETHLHNLDKANSCAKEEMVNEIAECNLYGQLLAEKMKPLDADDRLVLMNEIDNLVFKHLMNIRKRNKLARSARLSSTNQTYLDTRQSIDLPGTSHKSNQTEEASQNAQDSQYGIPMPLILKTESEASSQ